MSSYFDQIRKEVGELARQCPNDAAGTEQFLKGLMVIESRLVKTCELFAGDIDTPQDVREAIMGCIALHSVRYEGGEFLGDSTGPSKATRYAAACRSSKLEAEMHSLWHDIGRMRYVMRYGPVSDNPEWAVERRDRLVNEGGRPGPRFASAPLVYSDYRPPKPA